MKALVILVACVMLLALAASLGSTTSGATVAAARDGLIAFMRPGKVGEYDIWVVRPDGLGLRRLTTSPRNQSDYSPKWSPDGSSVLFERRGGSLPEEMRIVSARGAAVETLTAGCARTADCWGDGEGRYSADGRIAFTRATGPRSRPAPMKVAVHVMDANGTGIHQLSRPQPGYEDHEPSWSSDGRTVVFMRMQTGTVAMPTSLVAVDVASGTERLVYRLPRWAPGAGAGASFSPDGRRILFGFWCGFGDQCPANAYAMRNSRLATIRPDGRDLEILPIKLRADSGSWSPSGAQIVFRCHVPALVAGTHFKLCTSRADGTHVKQFPWPLESVHPSWGTHP
jgi:hypothetical protein